MNKIKSVLFIFFFALWACSNQQPDNAIQAGKLPDIFPKYYGTTIPYNIAPLNFKTEEPAIQIFISAKGNNGKLEKNFKGNKTDWALKEWSDFLEQNKGDSIFLSVFTFENKQWKAYKPIGYFVSPDPIDDYLFYRLIEPGYQSWNKMGLYQRQLSSFEETTILDNKIMAHSCMNCHTLSANNPDNLVFHIRGNNSGTIIIKDGKAKKLESKKPTKFKSVSFPSWHPSNKYIAFSINKICQMFPSYGSERAHAFDMGSDMVIYDVEKEEYFTSPLIYSENAFEAFPCFSPDGKSLYFISAPAAPMPQELRNIQYRLCRIDFDSATATLGESIDTLISPEQTGKSLTMPRISPDGKYILLTMSNYGNFPAYNEDADLYLYSTIDSTLIRLDEANSDQVESYHSWSSNGRWIVFSSRRMDGLFMNAYFAHIDENAKVDKPFLLPQKDPDFFQSFLFSFNLPEFSIAKIPVTPNQIEKAAKNSENKKTIMEITH
jgi:hypothetical protein